MKYHKNSALNQKILSTKSSYLDCEQKVGITKEDYDYDFFNAKMVSNSGLRNRYVNEIVSLCLNPSLMQNPPKSLMQESVKKAETYFKNVKVGAYTCSKGLEGVRKNIAKAMKKRDGHSIHEDDIYAVYGAMDAYQHILSLFAENDKVN